MLDDLGLASAVRSHAQRMIGDTGIAFSIDSSRLTARLPAELEIVLYRVFQEAVTNILRHARARNAWITLAVEDGWFVGEITDDGQGFDLEEAMGDPDHPRGLGLYGMRERVSQHNGRLEITSAPGQGTKIKLCVPIREVEVG
jgi:signal transduction histidine kinase